MFQPESFMYSEPRDMDIVFELGNGIITDNIALFLKNKDIILLDVISAYRQLIGPYLEELFWIAPISSLV